MPRETVWKKMEPDIQDAVDEEVRRLALLVAANCVRNTVIEDYHARGSISDPEMKVFNKEVANKLYTFLRLLIFMGTPEAQKKILVGANLYYPTDWDQPTLDEGILALLKLADAFGGTQKSST